MGTITYNTSRGKQVYDFLTSEQYPEGDDGKEFRKSVIDLFADPHAKQKASNDQDYADLLSDFLILRENASMVYEELAGISKPFTYPKWVIDSARKNADESTNDIMQSDIDDIISDSDDYETLVSELKDYCKS